MFAIAEKMQIDGAVLDVYALAESINFGTNSLIYRQVIAAADTMKLAGSVGNNAFLYGEYVEATDEYNVYGDLNYEAKYEMAMDNVTVKGEINYKEWVEQEEDTADTITDYILSAIGTIVFDIVLYMLLLFFAPKFIKKSKEYVSTHGLLGLAIGLGFVILVPIVAILLLCTGFLWGLSLFMIAIYVAVLMLNAFVVAIIANEFIADKLKIEDKFKKGLLLVAVSFVLWLIRQIAFIGSIVSVLVCIAGIGIIVLYQFDRRKEA